MKKSTMQFLVLLLGTSFSTYAQEAAVPASGGNASGAGGSVSYSVGQLFFTNISDAGGSMNEGIQSIAIINGILPVNLLSFTTTVYNGKSVLISWQTASEQNNDFFVLEKSLDGNNYKELTKVKGKGNSSSITAYQSFDHNPSSGNNFYRLKQVDFDGKFTYSGVRVANIENLLSELSVYPNPTSGILTLQTQTSASGTYQIADLNGKLFSSKPITRSYMQIDIRHLPSGIYMVNIIQGNKKVQYFKIIKD